MQTAAADWMEWAVHRVFFWESDNAKKGRILRALHHATMYLVVSLILISHTIYPAFWLQTISLVCCGLIWIQHITTHGCVSSKVEQRLIGDTTSFVDPFLEIVGIEGTETTKQGIVILGSTTVTGMLALEWLSRFTIIVRRMAQGLGPVVASSLHIPMPSSFPSGLLVPS